MSLLNLRCLSALVLASTLATAEGAQNSAAGVWRGIWHTERPTFALVLPGTGVFRLFMGPAGFAASGRLEVEDGKITGTCTGFLPPHQTGAVPRVQAVKVKGSIRPDRLALEFEGVSGRFEKTFEPDPEAHLPVSITELAGKYESTDGTGIQIRFSAPDATGSSLALSGTNSAGGTLLGTANLVGTNLNAFIASFTYTPPLGAQTKSFRGLLFLRNSNPRHLVLMADDGSGQCSGEFKKTD